MPDPFILMTGCEGSFKVMPDTAGFPDVVTPHATARVDVLALLTFQGVPSQRLQERTTTTRRIAVALPDLVLFRKQIDEMLRLAVEEGVLTITAAGS